MSKEYNIINRAYPDNKKILGNTVINKSKKYVSINKYLKTIW